MSSFPDVLSTELTYQTNGSNNKPTFTVPEQYAFAVVQVCLIPETSSTAGLVINTNHGSFSFVSSGKDFPILNLTIKGGESFSLTGSHLSAGGLITNGLNKAKVTALCHKKPF